MPIRNRAGGLSCYNAFFWRFIFMWLCNHPHVFIHARTFICMWGKGGKVKACYFNHHHHEQMFYGLLIIISVSTRIPDGAKARSLLKSKGNKEHERCNREWGRKSDKQRRSIEMYKLYIRSVFSSAISIFSAICYIQISSERRLPPFTSCRLTHRCSVCRL